MYIQKNISKRKSGKVYKSVLLCHKYRENGKIKTKVLANLSMLPDEAILSLENSIKNPGKGTTVLSKDISVEKVIEYGFFFILINLLNRLRISETLDKIMPKESPIVKLLIIGKIITRGSKLSIFNWIKRNPFYAQELGVNLKTLKLENLYHTVGLLPVYQPKIEKKWNLYNKSKTKDVFLYDITSSYFEGVKNQLAAFGYCRDGKKNKMQITIGLITDSDGFPLKIEVFKGNENDHKTVIKQLNDLKENFSAERVIFVGDRGMKIRYNLEKMSEIECSGIDYITGLTKDEIKGLLKKEVLQLDMFSKEIIEVSDGDTRYVLSINPELSDNKNKLRTLLRTKFEDEINELQQKWQKRKKQNKLNKEKIKAGHKNNKLVTKFSSKQIDSFKKRAFELLKKDKMTSYYSVTINAWSFKIEFNLEQYNKDKNLDGLYVVATSVKRQRLDTKQVREHYKKLQHVEHAFRDMKTIRLNTRPIFHVNEAQTRGHVLITMFSFAIIHFIEKNIFPMLKEINKQEKEQLSYKDIEEELKEIKVVELKIGKGIKNIQITKLSQRQKTIFKSLNIKENELTKIAM
ncbi:MAG: IS1634 family transposase [Desulfobacterales bacterium]|nr:IS1634 family transposase [Desulfobacterales bacterium]